MTPACNGADLPVSAMILAAGAAARMGRVKQLLPLGQTTILAQTIANVRLATELHEIILVLGHQAAMIRKDLPVEMLHGVKIIVNDAFGRGIASSLQAGLSVADPASSAALIILGDQPFVRPGTFDTIVQRYRDCQAGIAIPVYRGQRGNPVLLHRSLFGEALAMKGDVGFRSIFPGHLEKIVNVDVEDAGILQDIDDWEDYRRLSPTS
jgi:molybdenum cofactor cytidylyltransferase